MTFGFRDLTEDEMEFVSGGIVVTGPGLTPPPPPYAGGLGQIGFSGGWNWRSGDASAREDAERDQGDEEIVVLAPVTTAPPELLAKLVLPPDPDPDHDGTIIVTGDTCPTARAEAQQAIDALIAGSSIMRDVIAAANQDYQSLRLESDLSNAYYLVGSNLIAWDPFAAFEGVNTDGSTWYHSPALALAHELLHFAMPNATELEVIAMTNIVAAQLNQHFGTNFSTNRDQHGGGGSFLVSDAMAPNSSYFILNRPGCGN